MFEHWFRPNIGYVLHGECRKVGEWLKEMHCTPALVIADPPYGGILKETWDIPNVAEWIEIIRSLETVVAPGCPIYWWGGIGKPNNRPLLDFALRLERETAWRIRDWITWRKKRAYGKAKDYLFVREECLLLTKAGEAPRVFNTPYSEEKRGYAGYNPRYPAKSEFKRITNVWDDTDSVWEETELLKGKLHPAHKAPAVIKRPILTNSKKGELVLDLYSGSGETAVQAITHGRQVISVERRSDYCLQIVKRLDALCPASV